MEHNEINVWRLIFICFRSFFIIFKFYFQHLYVNSLIFKLNLAIWFYSFPFFFHCPLNFKLIMNLWYSFWLFDIFRNFLSLNIYLLVSEFLRPIIYAFIRPQSIQKSFYTRGTLRSIRIPRLTKIPTLYHNWLRPLK